MNQAVLNIVLPLFGIMLAGYLAGWFRLMDKDASNVLSKFVFNVAMPSLIFISLSRVSASEFFNWPFIGALGGGMMIIFCAGLAVARFAFPGSLTAQGLHGLTAMFSSTAYIGLPVVLTTFGTEALVPGVIGAVITVAIFFPIAITLAEIDRGGARSVPALRVFAEIVRNPLVLATASGLFVSAIGLPVPKPVETFCDLLGGAFVPLALFSAGLFLVFGTVRGDRAEVSWLVFAKLVLHPIVTWWLAYHVFELDGVLPAIAVIQAALPSGVPVFVLAQQYGVFANRSNAAIVVSTILSIVTLSALIVTLAP